LVDTSLAVDAQSLILGIIIGIALAYAQIATTSALKSRRWLGQERRKAERRKEERNAL